MPNRFLALVVLLVFAAPGVWLDSGTVTAQTQEASSAIPRTSDGHPDLTGIYDVATMRLGRQSVRPPIRYVETTLTFEELRASRQSIPAEAVFAKAHVGSSVMPSFLTAVDTLEGGSALSFTRAAPALMDEPPTDRRAVSQPTSKPSRRPRRRRRVVKAIKTAGINKTKIVLTKRDAERLRKSAEGANLLRSGRVIVVVDSVAAGIEGRLDVVPDDRIFARSK